MIGSVACCVQHSSDSHSVFSLLRRRSGGVRYQLAVIAILLGADHVAVSRTFSITLATRGQQKITVAEARPMLQLLVEGSFPPGTTVGVYSGSELVASVEHVLHNCRRGKRPPLAPLSP